MAAIIRNGKKIILTDEEIRKIREEEHKADIEYNVEQTISFYEEEEQISFDTWKNCPFANYVDKEDARTDFIAYIVEHILDEEDISEEHAPIGFRFVPDYDMEVLDSAKEFGYLKED